MWLALKVGYAGRQNLFQVTFLEFVPADHTESLSFRAIAFRGEPNNIEFAGVGRCSYYLLDLASRHVLHRCSNRGVKLLFLCPLECSLMFSAGQNLRARFEKEEQTAGFDCTR